MAIGKMVKGKLIYSALLVFVAAIMIASSSCDHKPLCEMHPHGAPMKINVNWVHEVAFLWFIFPVENYYWRTLLYN